MAATMEPDESGAWFRARVVKRFEAVEARLSSVEAKLTVRLFAVSAFVEIIAALVRHYLG